MRTFPQGISCNIFSVGNGGLAFSSNKFLFFDIAGDSEDFGAFKKEVERFYYEPDEEEERRWDDAFQKLRSGAVTPEPPFSELPKQPPENRPTQITVERLDQQEQGRRFMPTDNVVEIMTTAA